MRFPVRFARFEETGHYAVRFQVSAIRRLACDAGIAESDHDCPAGHSSRRVASVLSRRRLANGCQ